MKRSELKCSTYHNSRLVKAEGKLESKENRLTFEEHLDGCAACRKERAIFQSMEADDSFGPVHPPDDLTSRRFIDDVVQASRNTRRAQEDRPKSTSFRPWQIAAAAVLLISAGVTGVALLWSSPPPAPDQMPASPPGALTGAQVSVALVDGSSFVGEMPLLAESKVSIKTPLRVEKGRAALHLKPGIRLIAQPGSTFSFTRNDTEALELELAKGDLFFSVTPGRKGPPFRITTPKGMVQVKGTVFRMECNSTGVKVAVLRGEVLLTDNLGQSRILSSGECGYLGQSDLFALEEKPRMKMSSMLNLAKLLDTADNAVLSIRSAPVGASILLENTPIGKTPLAISLRAGHYEMLLEKDGTPTIAEHFSISKGQRLTRSYELSKRRESLAEEPGAIQTKHQRPVVSKGQKSNTPHELLARARAFRQSRAWGESAKAYGALIRQFPKSHEARSSQVALGELQLEKLGNPKGALKNFEAYLSNAQGPLAQEALYGKARAYRALGKKNAERKALKDFLVRYPSSVHTKKVMARLQELESDLAQPGQKNSSS